VSMGGLTQEAVTRAELTKDVLERCVPILNKVLEPRLHSQRAHREGTKQCQRLPPSQGAYPACLTLTPVICG